jgi:hypothetical protein
MCFLLRPFLRKNVLAQSNALITDVHLRIRDQLLEGVFHDPERALACVSGKEVLRQLSAWLHKEYGRGVSLRDILREIRAVEVPREIQEVVDAIEHASPFRRAAV